ncbi:MAG: hypothetical protein JO080_00335 [Mucilaginibacter sp.]|nr:hypothetical protein [Mucilaginibacter sp.]
MPVASKKNIEDKTRWLESKFSKTAFFISNNIRALFFPVKKLNILFSDGYPNEKSVRRGFYFLHHNIKFDAFTPENIKASDLVIPLVIEDARLLAQLRELLKDKLLQSSSVETVNICDNKFLFNETLVEKGFGDAIPKIGNNLPFPFLLKKRVSLGGDDSHVVTDEVTKKKLDHLIDSGDYFCQEIVEGAKEYATHILFKNDEIVATLTVEYTFFNDRPINGKEGFICSNIVKCPHLDAFAAILKAIDYEGICCFDYKVMNGKPKIFEINPRFGGSLGNYFSALLPQLMRASRN